jgi:hypothetical protein
MNLFELLLCFSLAFISPYIVRRALENLKIVVNELTFIGNVHKKKWPRICAHNAVNTRHKNVHNLWNISGSERLFSHQKIGWRLGLVLVWLTRSSKYLEILFKNTSEK